MNSLRFAVMVVALGTGTASAFGANLLTNGDFETGNFNGWTWTPTTFAEPLMAPTVVLFDTSGSGASLAFRVNPGTDAGHFGIGQEEGGTLSQLVPMIGGTTYNVQVGASAIMDVDGDGNADGGRMRLSIDGTLLWDWNVDDIDAATQRNSFSGQYTPAVGGNKNVSLLLTRTFRNSDPTVFHFVDNFSVSPIPEPSSLALLMLAGCTVQLAWQRRRRLP